MMIRDLGLRCTKVERFLSLCIPFKLIHLADEGILLHLWIWDNLTSQTVEKLSLAAQGMVHTSWEANSADCAHNPVGLVTVHLKQEVRLKETLDVPSRIKKRQKFRDNFFLLWLSSLGYTDLNLLHYMTWVFWRHVFLWWSWYFSRLVGEKMPESW